MSAEPIRLDAIGALVIGAAEAAGIGVLLLAIDDAHWADGASVALLSYVTRRIEGQALLVVVAIALGGRILRADEKPGSAAAPRTTAG